MKTNKMGWICFVGFPQNDGRNEIDSGCNKEGNGMSRDIP